MNGLTRYILRQSLAATIFVTAALSAAIWLTQSLRLVDLIVNRGLSLGLFLYLGLLTLPRFVSIVLPIAMFIAVLFTYYRLIAESEIVVMRAAGLSQLGLAKPALILATIGAALLFVLSAYLLPAATRGFKDLQFEIRNKFVSSVIQEGTFTAISENLTVYVRSREPNGELTGFVVQDERDREKPVTIIAERGAFVATSGGSRVFLVNGNRQQYDRSTGKLSVLSFDKYTLDLDDYRDAPGARTREPQERYLGELLFPEDQGLSDSFRDSLIIEAHQRLIAPLTAFTYAAIALLALLHGEFNRRGQLRRILLAVAMAVSFQVADLGFHNLASRLAAAIPLTYINVLLPIVLSSIVLFREPRRAMPRRALRMQPAE
jgi:lipopolysaccharide export system permease protein